MSEAAGRAVRSGSPSVVIVAGEASGDATGARLALALQRKLPGLVIEGIGGRQMAAAGVALLADSSRWGAIGIADALAKIPRVWRALRRLRARLMDRRPLGIVFIDAGGVNMALLRMVRGVATKRMYYMPPGSWSRRPRSQALPELVDVIATPFPWSRDLLSGGRARVEWVGHPVVEMVQPQLTRAEAYRKYELEPDRPVVAVAPGSREQEMGYVLPLLARASSLLAHDHPGAQFIVPVSDTAYEKRISDAFERFGSAPFDDAPFDCVQGKQGRQGRRFGLPVTLLRGMDYDALQLADVAAVCSGTATLEFACLGTPMVIVYKASILTTLQFVLFRGVIGGQWRAGMPNIIAGRDIVPEFLWRFARPEPIARELSSLLSDATRRERMRSDLAEVRQSLGEGRASERAADLLLDLIGARA
jgi:lipid-A-disaccharide synthase